MGLGVGFLSWGLGGHCIIGHAEVDWSDCFLFYFFTRPGLC